MLWFLRVLFLTVIVSMLAITGWASSRCALFAIPREVFTHPWFIATLFDAYWAFIAFYVWVAWKEQTLAARILWFIAIILLGNLVTRAFCPDCGAPVLSTNPAVMPGMTFLRASSLDDLEVFKPQMHVFTMRAATWDTLSSDVPAFEKMPPGM